MNSKIDMQLFNVAIEPWNPHVIQQIKRFCADGANPNLICTEASTSRGHVRAGLSLSRALQPLPLNRLTKAK